MPVAEAVHGIRFIMFTETKWKKSHSTCPGCKDTAMQVSHQRRRHNANSTWPEHRQQFNSGAPALNSLISSDVLAHETRIAGQGQQQFARMPNVRFWLLSDILTGVLERLLIPQLATFTGRCPSPVMAQEGIVITRKAPTEVEAS